MVVLFFLPLSSGGGVHKGSGGVGETLKSLTLSFCEWEPRLEDLADFFFVLSRLGWLEAVRVGLGFDFFFGAELELEESLLEPELDEPDEPEEPEDDEEPDGDDEEDEEDEDDDDFGFLRLGVALGAAFVTAFGAAFGCVGFLICDKGLSSSESLALGLALICERGLSSSESASFSFFGEGCGAESIFLFGSALAPCADHQL